MTKRSASGGMGFSEKQCGPFVKMEVAWPEGGAYREGLGDEVGL